MTIAVANTLTSNTFAHWLDNTNKLADAMSNKVLTVNSNTTVGNCTLHGTFSANIVHIYEKVTGTTISLEANLVLAATGGLTTNGPVTVSNNFTINTVSKLFLKGSGANTHFLRLTDSTTGAVAFANLDVTLASLTDVVASPTSNNDILRWNTATSKWNVANIQSQSAMTIANLAVTEVSSNLISTGAKSTLNSTVYVVSATNRMGVGVVSPTVTVDVNGAIKATGDITGLNTSDGRLKKNTKRIKNALGILDKIEGVMFDWDRKAIKGNQYISPKGPGKDAGVIAQQVQEVYPVAVGARPDGILAVDYTKLVPLIIEGLHELREEVEAIKAT